MTVTDVQLMVSPWEIKEQDGRLITELAKTKVEMI